jgi:hypothetical protein
MGCSFQVNSIRPGSHSLSVFAAMPQWSQFFFLWNLWSGLLQQKTSSFIPVYRRQKAFSPVMDSDKQGWERLFLFLRRVKSANYNRGGYN